jgi:hypothetical protein
MRVRTEEEGFKMLVIAFSGDAMSASMRSATPSMFHIIHHDAG